MAETNDYSCGFMWINVSGFSYVEEKGNVNGREYVVGKGRRTMSVSTRGQAKGDEAMHSSLHPIFEEI